MEIRIAGMQQSHLDDVIEIEILSFPTPWSRTAFFHEISSNDFAVYLVALVDGKVAGYAGMWIILDEAHVTTLGVHPSLRRQKIGVGLLRELISESRRRECMKMTLEVRPSNLSARDLYAKAGFISHGIRPGYYSDTKEDAVIMWKDL